MSATTPAAPAPFSPGAGFLARPPRAEAFMLSPDKIQHKRLTIFDLDGTLLDYDSEERAASLAVCRTLSNLSGKPLPETLEMYRQAKTAARQLPASSDQLGYRFRYFCTSLGLARYDARRLRKRYVAWRVGACKAYPWAADLAAAFAARSEHMAVLTNGADDLQKRRLAAAGISKYFRLVYTSQRLGYAKPDPRAFECVHAPLGVKPAEWRMVGDDPEKDLAVPGRLGAETWLVEGERGAVSRWGRENN